MGSFDKIFKRASETVKSPKKGLRAAFNPIDTPFARRAAEFLKDPTSKRGRRVHEESGTILGAGMFMAVGGSDQARQFFKKERDPSAPAAGDAPAMGAGTQAAKAEARKKALQRAAQRFGFRQTVATTPLGVQGQGAALGKKQLVGE